MEHIKNQKECKMRVFQAKGEYYNPPKKAGVAILEWSQSVSTPSRDKKVIQLPSAGPVDFYPLLGGSQFLVSVWDKQHEGSVYHNNFRWTQSLYFGGTDEQPFLVQLDPKALDSLMNGEEAFFRALKPQSAATIEQKLGYVAKRQGDWFAVPFPPTTGIKSLLDVLDNFELIDKSYPDFHLRPTNAKGEAIGRTRHMIKNGWVGSISSIVLAEGILTAPDHEDLELSGPHALFQTAHLVNPQKAD